MQFCVIGLGRFGSAVARTLADLGHEVLAVDRDEDPVAEVEPFVTQGLVLDATQEKALKNLGLRDFEWVIVAIGDLESSILITVLLKEMGVPRVLAKALSDIHAKILRKVGADRVVFPERDMGQRVARSLASPMVFDYLELTPGYSIVEIAAPKEFAGKTLKDLRIRNRFGVTVIAIRRKEPELKGEDGALDFRETTIVSPTPEEEIHEGDILVVLGSNEDIEKLRKAHGEG